MEDITSDSSALEEQLIAKQIEQLVAFALQHELIEPLDIDAARNALFDLFAVKEPAAERVAIPAGSLPDSPVPLLNPLLDKAYKRGLLPDDTVTFRDLFDARIMGLLMPRSSETNRQFQQLIHELDITAATDWFYKLNIACNYIRMDRIKKNEYWKHRTTDGELEITINLSKPEKDPREIALLKTMTQSHYPQCLLCKENVGYAGRPDHPARQNLRIIPLALQGEAWFFQYSPYVYYNEHSIVFRGDHVPMVISPATFERLLDFVEQLPHYFIGSNADLPIVGGSILNHDHFQAGRHVFPMELAPVSEWVSCAKAPEVSMGIVQWPMSVVRFQSSNREAIVAAATHTLTEWRKYSDLKVNILAFSDNSGEAGGSEHNTITPIARMKDTGIYELDLVLRNNRTSEEHPYGIFHPHQELHHIKRENIGLIEVMGLAVLPGRLQTELSLISKLLTGEVEYQADSLASSEHPLHSHADWISTLINRHGTSQSLETARQLLQNSVGDKFHEVLQDAGVFKADMEGREAFKRFLKLSGLQ